MNMPIIVCPKCKAEYEDFDGFGVQYCHSCEYCIHPSRSVENGVEICDTCGEVIK